MNVKLSDDLRAILEYELANGNDVAEIAFPEDRVCVVLKLPFRIRGTDAEQQIPASVGPFDFDDPHYGDGPYSGFKSKDSGHVLAVKSAPHG